MRRLRPLVRRLRALERRLPDPLRMLIPRSLQARLTLAFVGITALTLALVSVVVVNRLDDYFRDQVQNDLRTRAMTVRDITAGLVAQNAGSLPVVSRGGDMNPAVAAVIASDMGALTRIAQANLQIDIGTYHEDPVRGATWVSPASGGSFAALLAVQPQPSQARDPEIGAATVDQIVAPSQYGIQITLSNPLTVRAATLRTVTTLLLALTVGALIVAILVAAFLARRFTDPIRRLTHAASAMAEGDLSVRVPEAQLAGASSEVADLSSQFNAMADRLEESMAIIRHDRDRSRDFLADVSHELRTPIAAMRTFVELLQGAAGSDPAARQEFLASSAQQLERLDWLAQNLLELSKLESGLVLLDLRPEDLRATVQSAVEQAEPGARRRELTLRLELPDAPVRIRHDPPRIGQVVSNLVGNALKFTPRGGAVSVELRARPDGARIAVRDTGVGIEPAELPHIFERFYRGSHASEARSSGSGLGLAIVKSIVDMHNGRLTVESRTGHGTLVTVDLPADPRTVERTDPAAAPGAGDDPAPAAGTEGAADPRPPAGGAPPPADHEFFTE